MRVNQFSYKKLKAKVINKVIGQLPLLSIKLKREKFNLCDVSLMENYVLEFQFKLASAIKSNTKYLNENLSYELFCES